MRTKELDQIAEQMEIDRQKPTLIKGIWSITKFLFVNGFRGIKRVITSNSNGLKACFGFVSCVSLFSTLFMTLGDLGVNLYSVGASSLFFAFSVILGATREREPNQEIDYDLNDDWLEVYDKLKMVEDYETGQQYPHLANIEENEKVTTYTFWSNGNKINDFVKGKEFIEEFLNAEILEITRNTKDRRLIDIKVIDEPLETFYRWGSNIVPPQGNILIGKSIKGDIQAKFSSVPHWLIAGETGGGKTVAVKNIIMQVLDQSINNESVTLKIADFKGAIDYSVFENVLEVIEDKKRLATFTTKLIKEMEDRIKLVKSHGVENVDEYNKISDQKINRVVLVIDELVECLDKDGLDKTKDKKEIELIDTISSNITKLARLSRAVNINMVLGTQLPTSSCLGNQLKNNIVGRLCGRFADESASRVVLSSTKAKELPDTKGRMMYKLGADIVEVQTPFINNSFIKYYLKENKDLLKLVEIGEQKQEENVINLNKNDKVIQGNFQKEEIEEVSFEELRRQKLAKKSKEQ